ncbi:MAG: MBL fold metallo-hydrolase [Alphaproteobacteria bacterium]|nr:MBL fold metallo-hydrolase [Alphaproteobacteria bacterium]
MSFTLTRLITRPMPDGLAWQGPSEGGHVLRWLGAAGFAVRAGQRTVLIDPYLSRFSLLATATRPLVPDEPLLARELPQADAVLVGHAHFDHALDAPAVCRHTGARLYGSRSTANIGRAYGLPEDQLVTCEGMEELDLGWGRAVPLPSRHGRVYFGRTPLQGDIEAPPRWPPRYRALRHGKVFSWWLEWQGLSIVHIDSADYDTALMQGRRADVLCLCAIGRKYRPGYTAEIIAALKPGWVVACHWEDFFAPLSAPPRQLPAVDLPGFVEEIRACGADPVVLRPGQRMGL